MCYEYLCGGRLGQEMPDFNRRETEGSLEGIGTLEPSPPSTAWVRPRVDVTILNPSKSFDEIVRRWSSIYRIGVEECFGTDDCFDVRIETLRADCPFCEEGAGQVLASENWVGLFDWSCAQVSRLEKALSGTCAAVGDNEAMYRFNRTFFEMLEYSRYALEGSDDRRLEGTCEIDALNLSAFDPRQLQMSFPDVPGSSRSFVAHADASDLTGVYECPHCKSHFAVSLCSDKAAREETAERKVREAIIWHIDFGSGSIKELERFSVRLAQSDREVEVLYCLDENEHSIVFDRHSGATRFDGRRISDSGYLTLIDAHPIFAEKLFGNPALMRCLSKVFSMPYDKLTWGSNAHNLKMLVAINRFRGYPFSFYEGIVQDERLFLSACDVCSAVPRCYEDLERLFDLTGLPSKKSIRRRLLGDPLRLCAVAFGADIPFRNTDVICRFLDLPWNHPLFQLLLHLDYWERPEAAAMAVGLRVICEIRGDAQVFNYVASLSGEQLYEFSEIMGNGYWVCSRTVKEAIAKSPLKDLYRLLFFSRKVDMVGPGIDVPYCYTADRQELEDRIGEFDFKLAATPRELVTASFDLKNCLRRYVCDAMEMDEVYILIRERGKCVGAVSVGVGGRVIEAHSACNYPLGATLGLSEAFNEWCDRHDLTFS